MKIIVHENNKYVLRFDRGEEVISSLQVFCGNESIKAGVFSGIGAVGEAVLSWYDHERKELLDKTLNADLEVTGLTGNVSLMNNNINIHAHGSFSDSEMLGYGGHVKKMIVSGTCEIVLEKFESVMARNKD
ncbi:MAG: DNA-binding protein, partial [Candidatus Sungbacteria bacterium]|nr:DNA-binding protein [Candidatus Sungbacteria bacterium]